MNPIQIKDMTENEKPLFPRESKSDSEVSEELREAVKQKLEEAERAANVDFSGGSDFAYCETCGMKNARESRFCETCGGVVFRKSDYQEEETRNVYGPPPIMNMYGPPPLHLPVDNLRSSDKRENAPADKGRNNIFIVICAGIAAAFLAVAVLFFVLAVWFRLFK